MVKYMKDHIIVVIAVLLLLAVICFSFFIKQMFFSNSKNVIYGNRLNGIDEVAVTSSEQKSMIEALEGDSSVSKVKYHLQGKIINVIITVNDDVGADTAKVLTGKVLEFFNEDQKKFYDFQVMVKKENGANDFPIIGYKHSNKDGFSFTKDRAAS